MKKILFIGTSHLDAFLKAWKSMEPLTGISAEFFGLSEPVWTGLFNCGTFRVKDGKLFLPSKKEISDSFSFNLKAEHVRAKQFCLSQKYIFDAVDNIAKVVFVDCNFRCNDCLWKDHEGVYFLKDTPVSLELLLNIDRFAGVMHCFSGPHKRAGLFFREDKETSFISLFKQVRELLPNTPIDLICKHVKMSSILKKTHLTRYQVYEEVNKTLYKKSKKPTKGNNCILAEKEKQLFAESMAANIECHQRCTDRLGLNIRHIPQPLETLDEKYGGTIDKYSVSYGKPGELNDHCIPQYARLYFNDIMDY